MKEKSNSLKHIFKIFLSMVLIGIVIISAHIISAHTLDKKIEYKRVSFHTEKIPAEMNGYNIVFISDTHDIKEHELEDIVSEVNKLQPNLLILGGDFTWSSKALQRLMKILSRIEAADGIYGVEGNHDRHKILFAAMRQYSFQPLSNSGSRIRENFYLAGVEDLWNRKPDVEKAIKGAQENDFILLVSHNPDVAMLQDTAKVDLILSGHTHGGHATFFGLWAPELTLRKSITGYGQRFMSGWSKSRDGVPVYVSNGTGYYLAVPRVFARPQVILLTLSAG